MGTCPPSQGPRTCQPRFCACLLPRLPVCASRFPCTVVIVLVASLRLSPMHRETVDDPPRFVYDAEPPKVLISAAKLSHEGAVKGSSKIPPLTVTFHEPVCCLSTQHFRATSAVGTYDDAWCAPCACVCVLGGGGLRSVGVVALSRAVLGPFRSHFPHPSDRGVCGS